MQVVGDGVVLLAPLSDADANIAHGAARTFGVGIANLGSDTSFDQRQHVILIGVVTPDRASSIFADLARIIGPLPRSRFSWILAPTATLLEKRVRTALEGGRQLSSVRGWILAPRTLKIDSSFPLERYHTDDFGLSDFRSLCAVRADLAVIVGHGREDLVYFPRLALCGRPGAQNGQPPFPCTVDRCPYPQEKAAIQAVNARIVVFFSCSAVRPGAGLFPYECRLFDCALSAGTAAVMGPTSLFTLSSDLVEECLRYIFSGCSISETSDLLNHWQTRRVGREEQFTVAGDGSIRTAMRLLTASADAPLDRALAAVWTSRFRNLDMGMSQLAEMNVQTPTTQRFADLVRGSLDLRSRAIVSLTRASSESAAGLSVLEMFDRELTVQDLGLATTLQMRSRREFFWLAAQTPNRYVTNSVAGICVNCHGKVANDVYSHPIQHDVRRRITCEKCGIVADYAPTVEGVHLSLATLVLNRSRFRIVINVHTQQTYRCTVAAAFNHSAGWSIKVAAVTESGKTFLPAFVDLAAVSKLEISGHGAPKGVHYFQLFVVQDLCVSSVSIPVPMWCSGRWRDAPTPLLPPR